MCWACCNITTYVCPSRQRADKVRDSVHVLAGQLDGGHGIGNDGVALQANVHGIVYVVFPLRVSR